MQSQIFVGTFPAVYVETVSNSGYQTLGTSLTWAHVHNGDFLTVDVQLLGLAGVTVSGITYNGVALTQVGVQASATGAVRGEAWRLIGNAAGSQNIVVTFSGSIAAGAAAGEAVSYNGVHQTSPTEGFVGATATNVGAADAIVSITSVAEDCLIHAAAGSNDTSITAGQTSRNNATGALGSGANEDFGPQAAGAKSMNFTDVGALFAWVIYGYAIRPASASAGETLAPGSGTAGGTSTVTGIGASVVAGAGSAVGTVTVAGIGSSAIVGIGSASGVGAASGIGSSIVSAAGSISGTGAADGIGASTVAGAGQSDGIAVVTGAAASLSAASGTADGSCVVSSGGASLASGSGTADGTCTVVGIGASSATGSGSAASTSTVTGGGASTASGAGAAAGASTVVAIGASLASGAGTAAGTCTVVGIGASVVYNLDPDAIFFAGPRGGNQWTAEDQSTTFHAGLRGGLTYNAEEHGVTFLAGARGGLTLTAEN